jgi:hypothetical protein
MSARPDRDYGSLVKSIALLDSPVEAERVAALEAVNRQLAVMGLRWRDIADELPVARADRGTHIARAAALVKGGGLSAWETKFCLSLEGFASPTQRQLDKFADIENAVRVRQRAAGPAT